MNANELADELEDDYWDSRAKKVMLESAKMLRQQQEKLTKYELRHVAQRDRIAILEMQHKQQQAEIEALKKEAALQRLSDFTQEADNEPVAWINEEEIGIMYAMKLQGAKDWKTNLGLMPEENDIPLYTHPAKNNGGNPEELNTRQIQDARTSLESTPPFAYAVVSKECPDNMENMSLQFNEPVDAKKVIPLYERPIDVTDEEIWAVANDYFVGKSNLVYGFARAILRKAQE